MGGIGDFFKSKKEDVQLQELLTPEQKKAREALMQYGLTGVTPSGYRAGEAYDLSRFDFGVTPYETAGLSRLFSPSADIESARKIYGSMSDTTFRPEDESTGLGAFRKALQREVGAASDVLNREAAITGSRFGTGIQRQKTDLAAQQSEQLASKLAELFTGQQNRAMQAASGLAGLEGLESNRLAQLFNYGGLQRELANQKAQLAYNEKQRQRDEQLATLGTLGSIFSTPIQYGQTSYTIKTPSLFSKLATIATTAAGAYFGGPQGAQAGKAFGETAFTPDQPASYQSARLSSPSSLGYTSYTGLR